MNNTLEKLKNKLPKSLQDIYPDTRIEKFLVELPMLAWRLGLGPILGRRIMVLTHIGRKTGKSRRTAVEFYVLNGMKYIPCAFGVRAQWYRNILANPRVTIQTADGSEPMLAVRVSDEEELTAIIDMVLGKTPMMMDWYRESLGIGAAREELLTHMHEFVFLRFDPTSDPTPHGLEVDLAWLWPVLLLFTMFRRSARKKR